MTIADTDQAATLTQRQQHEQDVAAIRNFLVCFADELGGAEQVADSIQRINEDLIVKMDPVVLPDPDACKECVEDQERRDAGLNGPTNWWHCSDCKTHVARWRGQGDVQCPNCDAEYNAGGQRLRDDWRGNASSYDEDVSDMEGYEAQHSDDDRW